MIRNIILIEDETRIRHKLKNEILKVKDMAILGSANTLSRAYDLIKEKSVNIVVVEAHFILNENQQFVRKLLNIKPLLIIAIAKKDDHNKLITIRKHLPIHHIIIKDDDNQSIDFEHLLSAICNYSEKEDDLYTAYRKKQAEFIAKRGEPIIAIGASTGGVQAIETVVSNLVGDLPPILMVQHISKTFSSKMADRICKTSKITVKEGEQGEILRKNIAYLAPGDCHMTIKEVRDHYEICLDQGPLVHFQRPAVENLFDSVASVIGNKAIGVLLTGMGADGAKGLLTMRKAGGYTLAQDAKSSVIFGMPKAAIEMGSACEVVHLDQVASRLVELSRHRIYDTSYLKIG